ncbi:MAG: flagellar basal-body MS-ring/collar protein FliF, partial [Porticoccus sp.]
SVADLTFDNITVVDQAGNLLSDLAGNNNSQGNTQLSHTLEVESKYQERIENILAPLFGKENIRIQVTAQINFSQREETVEHYAPNQNTKQAAIRSAQWSSNGGGASSMGKGVPGALSNSPPSPSLSLSPSGSKDNTGENATVSDETQGQQNDTNNFQSDNTVNYEVDRNITHIQHQSAQVERLSSAVVVNYLQDIDEEGNPTQTPLTDNELEQVTLLVKQAMGFSSERGDEVQIVNSPFTEALGPVMEEETATFWASPQGQELVLILARYLPIGFAALVLYFLIIRPLLKRHLAHTPTTTTTATATTTTTTTKSSNSTEGKETPEVAPSEGISLVSSKSAAMRKQKVKSYEQNVADLQQVAQEDPRLFAMIVRTWMNNK